MSTSDPVYLKDETDPAVLWPGRGFGVPFAQAEFIDGKMVKICPVCGERCPEAGDEHGELTTNTYGQHYATAHPKPADSA